MIYSWINFLILAGVLGFVGYRKLNEAFRKQREALQNRISEIGNHHEKMKIEYELIKTQVELLSDKIGELKKKTDREVDFEVSRLETEAHQMIQKISQDGASLMAIEVEKARKLLERQIFEKATAIAREKLERTMTSADSDWTNQIIRPESIDRTEKKNYAS